MKTQLCCKKQKNSGQIVIEYVLLLVISITIVTLVIKKVASRDPDSPGFLVQKWCLVLKAIGSDIADENVQVPTGSGSQSSSSSCP